MSKLPDLHASGLGPTRDHLRDISRVLGALQRAYLEKTTNQWEYGLEVGMRGPCTRQFTVAGSQVRGVIDLVRAKVRLPDAAWSIEEYDGPGLLAAVYEWLADHNAGAIKLDDPKFDTANRIFDAGQAQAWGEALWWFHEQFTKQAALLSGGLVSPVLLYPHHFDLAFSWLPGDNERQLTMGFSTGGDSVDEPYVYITDYPDSGALEHAELPAGARLQTEGFAGAVLPYAELAKNSEPEQLLAEYARLLSGTAQ